MKIYNLAFASAALWAFAVPCIAANVAQPGQQVGLAGGYPLPEGFYAIDTFSLGRADRRNASDVGVNIPILVWSSPFTLLGARVEPLVSLPSLFVNPNNPAPIPNRNASVMGDAFIGNVFAWNLGNGFGVSYLLGFYLPVSGRGSLGLGLAGTPLVPQFASSTLRQTWTFSYVGDGSYNLSAALTYGLTLDDRARFGGAVGAVLGPQAQADNLTLDITATKKFGRFEIGPVAYGSTDLTVNRNIPLYANYRRAGQIAVGGLIGYTFDNFIIQTYVTRDLITRATTVPAQRNEETRGWLRIIVPLYVAETGSSAPAQVVQH